MLIRNYWITYAMDRHQHQTPVDERLKVLFALQKDLKEMMRAIDADGFRFEQATEKCDEFIKEMNRLIKGFAVSKGTSFQTADYHKINFGDAFL